MKDNIVITILVVVLLWNFITFLMMKMDKKKAIKDKRRISEKTLFLSAFIFGGFGIWGGMYAFRHKTKHWSFKIVSPLACIINAIILFLICKGVYAI